MTIDHKKRRPYKPTDGNATLLVIWFIIVGIITACIFYVLAVIAFNIRLSKRENVTDTLCTITQPCDLTIIIEFDSEPINPTIISPSGSKYTFRTLKNYEESRNKLSAVISTDDIGDWKIEYPLKTNKNLSITTQQDASTQLFVSDFSVQTTPGEINIGFTTAYGLDIAYTCLVMFKTETIPTILYKGNFELNRPVSLSCDTSKLIDTQNAQLSVFLFPSDENKDEYPVLFAKDGMEFMTGRTSYSWEYIDKNFTYQTTPTEEGT